MKKLFLQFSPKHIKWSQFGYSSKRIFSKKLSASGGPDPHQGLCPQTPIIGLGSHARHGNPNPPFTNPAYTPDMQHVYVGCTHQKCSSQTKMHGIQESAAPKLARGACNAPKKQTPQGCKNTFLKTQTSGFYWVLGLNAGFVVRPNLTGSGISMGFQLLEWPLLGRYSPRQINIRYCSFILSFIISKEQFKFLQVVYLQFN